MRRTDHRELTRAAGIWLLAGVAGCSGVVDFSNQGSACLVSGDSETFDQALDEGASTVFVEMVEGFGSNWQVEEASCDVTVHGSTIRVRSRGKLRDRGGPEMEDLRYLTAGCPGPLLTEGQWTLAYGGHSVSFAVPGDADVCVDSE
ncbi:MAG: hypothetical protein H6738_18265 [Alphaproteobacteria bacterium]|nr:hypothetical protein [Alphaproteobacteria bacterium]